MKEEIVAFADEYGNNSFKFDSQGTHFIVAAIFTNKIAQNELETQMESIRKKYFQTGEMKSRKVADNHQRRVKILQELVKSDFHIYSVIVDKRELNGEGFQYKKSFYKFLNGLVYKQLYKTFPNLQLTVDEHGSNDFMRGFKKYVEKNHIPTLFWGSDFYFAPSPDSVLVQLADFIAGTSGRCFDETKKSNESKKFLQILKPRIASIDFFPTEKTPLEYHPDKEEEGYDPVIAELAVNLSQNFINKKKSVVSSEEADQMNCLKLLILYFKAFDHKKYISAQQIMNHLNVGKKDKITRRYFRTNVIAKLRDKGILIASSENGYKLPTCSEDLYSFVNRGNTMILPILSRIKKCRDQIKIATQNKLDILDKPEYLELKDIFEAQEKIAEL